MADNHSLEEPGSAYMNNARYPVPRPPMKNKSQKRRKVGYILICYQFLIFFLNRFRKSQPNGMRDLLLNTCRTIRYMRTNSPPDISESWKSKRGTSNTLSWFLSQEAYVRSKSQVPSMVQVFPTVLIPSIRTKDPVRFIYFNQNYSS